MLYRIELLTTIVAELEFQDFIAYFSARVNSEKDSVVGVKLYKEETERGTKNLLCYLVQGKFECPWQLLNQTLIGIDNLFATHIVFASEVSLLKLEGSVNRNRMV